MMDYKPDKMVEVFSGTSWEAEMVVSLLKDAKIDSFTKNSVLNTFLYDPIYSSGVKVMISDSDLKPATEIVNEYYKNMRNNVDLK
jgi:hypothetical protein